MSISDIFRREASVPPRPMLRDLEPGTSVLEMPSTPERKAADLPDVRLPDTERIRALARHSQAESIVFQSVAVGALQLLDRVLKSEQQLAEAAISLAQRNKMDQMIQSLEATAAALQEALSRQGKQMLNLAGKPEGDGSRENSWWFSLTDTMHTLEEGTEWIATVVARQPKGSAARLLSSIIARLLHNHYNKLLTEAGQWME